MDKKKALKIVGESGFELENLPKKLKKDKEIVLTAVKNFGSALEYADDSLKKDKEIVLIAVKQDGTALEHSDDSFKKNKEIVLIAVEQNLDALKYADKTFKKNINISFINFEKLKKNMDNDGDFLHWDTDEKVSITRTGSSDETEYRVSVESNQDEETSEYDVYGEFGSTIDEIESSVECFIENGGDILSFQNGGYLNDKKILKELK